MELKILNYKESGEAYAEGTAAFDKKLPPLIESEGWTIRRIGAETETEDNWGVRSVNLAQARLTARQIVAEFDKAADTHHYGHKPHDWDIIEELRRVAG